MSGPSMQIQVAGHPWFHRDDYDSFREVLPDRKWHASFDAWERAALQTVDQLEKRGIVVVKAHIRSNEFVAWCRASGLDINSQSLVAFANEAAARQYIDEKGH